MASMYIMVSWTERIAEMSTLTVILAEGLKYLGYSIGSKPLILCGWNWVREEVRERSQRP